MRGLDETANAADADAMGQHDISKRAFLREASARTGSDLSNWGLLRTFYFVADSGSITAAARRLSISQPSVSASLQRLEDQIGQKLINRTSRDFALTAHGRVLFTETERMFRAAERAGTLLAQQTSGLTGQVHVQTVTGGRSPVFDETLRLMHQRHPAVSFRIDISSSRQIIRNVAERVVPFGICLMLRPFSGLDCRLILRAEYGIFCGREHPLFGRRDIKLDDLRHEGFIGFACSEEGNAPEPYLVLRTATGLGENTVGTSSDIAEIIRMISVGLGVGILPLPAAKTEVQNGNLWRLAAGKLRLEADLYFITNPEARLTETESVFLATFTEALAMAPRGSVVHSELPETK